MNERVLLRHRDTGSVMLGLVLWADSTSFKSQYNTVATMITQSISEQHLCIFTVSPK